MPLPSDLLVIKRPSYKFSVWMVWGRYIDRKVSTFTLEEAMAWRDYLNASKSSREQQYEVRDGDY